MFDKIATIAITALVVTGVGIALRPKAPTAAVLRSATNGFANIEKAAYGPK
jgi:hypothetical protein